MSISPRQVALIFGGNGALGRNSIELFKSHSWMTISIDFSVSEVADHSIELSPLSTLSESEISVIEKLKCLLGKSKLKVIMNAAGGWAGGNISDSKVCQNAELMWKQSCGSSILSGVIAGHFLSEHGVLCFVGAHAASGGTPSMIAYGMAKASVHQLTKSLAAPESGVPPTAKVLCVCPITLDTPNNRKYMANSDFTAWTKCQVLSQKIYDWATGKELITSGSILSVITKNDQTSFNPI